MTLDYQGNAFFLLGQVKSIGEYRGFSATKIKNICDEMTSGDYENLVSVFDNPLVTTLYWKGNWLSLLSEKGTPYV